MWLPPLFTFLSPAKHWLMDHFHFQSNLCVCVCVCVSVWCHMHVATCGCIFSPYCTSDNVNVISLTQITLLVYSKDSLRHSGFLFFNVNILSLSVSVCHFDQCGDVMEGAHLIFTNMTQRDFNLMWSTVIPACPGYCWDPAVLDSVFKVPVIPALNQNFGLRSVHFGRITLTGVFSLEKKVYRSFVQVSVQL